MESLTPGVDELVSAKEAALLLQRSRSCIQRLQKKGKITAIPTNNAKYYFKKSEVLKLKEVLISKSKANEKV
ncbi:helix-turn-helix domain-containing protein [Flavobacterium enshiense]|uniref:helix-turn-helix domain-containing protein n=1 Tax=Flavobacterium enshiense TaxID=1341165 RepID=UPI00345C6621